MEVLISRGVRIYTKVHCTGYHYGYGYSTTTVFQVSEKLYLQFSVCKRKVHTQKSRKFGFIINRNFQGRAGGIEIRHFIYGLGYLFGT